MYISATNPTPNLPTNIVDFRGFDSSIILILRGGFPRPIGYSQKNLSQAMLVGVILVGRLGVLEVNVGLPPSPRMSTLKEGERGRDIENTRAIETSV